MKLIKLLTITIAVINSTFIFGQSDPAMVTNKNYTIPKLTLDISVGLKPYPMSDMVFSGVLQWNIKKRFSLISYTSYTYNSAFLRDFNYIHTDYNYSISQKVGIGTSFYSKHSSHTFSLLGGFKYDASKETLDNPEFDKATMSISSLSPDFGLMYHYKKGIKKYFFSYKMYVPIYPYPFKTTDIYSIDGNFANVTLEFGIGMRFL